MKHVLILAMTLLLSQVAFAQYNDLGARAIDEVIPAVDETHEYARKGSRLVVDGRKLSLRESEVALSDICGTDYSTGWKRARGWRTAGISMIAGGSAVGVTGLAISFVGVAATGVGVAIGGGMAAVVGGNPGDTASQVAKKTSPILVVGVSALAIGTATAIAGIPILAVSCSNMNGIVRDCNAAKEVKLTFGPTQDGIGLALRF